MGNAICNLSDFDKLQFVTCQIVLWLLFATTNSGYTIYNLSDFFDKLQINKTLTLNLDFKVNKTCQILLTYFQQR